MKSICKTWATPIALAAAIGALVLSFAAQATPGDGSLMRADVAANDVAADDVFNGAAQLAAGNAAYARGDYAEAFRLYRNIAVLGIAEAHYRLGLMYAAGQGTRKSLRQAEYWLKQAAAQNYPGAADALASIKAAAIHG